MQTIKGKRAEILHDTHPENIRELLLSLRGLDESTFDAEVIHDPMLLPDIEKAVDRIFLAKEKGERVMIFGDYDVDGISSTAALFLFLRDEMGMDVSYRLPHRVHDGYGIKSYHMEEIATTGAKLVITVDCGTKDAAPIARAYELGMDVIVTDHHSCPPVLPECVAVVNPKRTDSKYPFSGLSGSGVVWKVIHAILQKLQSTNYKVQSEGLLQAPLSRGELKGGSVSVSESETPRPTATPSSSLSLSEYCSLRVDDLDRGAREVEEILQKYVDIVSLGTVADCMPMIDENRAIVRRGILQSQQSHHPFFQTFVDTLKRPILTEEDIGFFIGPMLNAGGRITTPYQSLSTLLASSLDSYARIQELMGVNETRKGKSRDALENALETIDSSLPLLIYINPTLEHGVLGLVAAKLTDIYHKPSAVFTLHEGYYVGSLRAPPGIDLVKILDASAGHLARYGGHAGAAGCTIEESQMDLASVRMQEATNELYSGHDATPKLVIDSILDVTGIDLDLLEEIESLRPFGQSFSAPLFMIRDVSAPIRALGQTGEHIRWEMPGNLEVVGFRMGEYMGTLSGHPHHLIGTLKAHTWRDTTTPQFHVMDAILSEQYEKAPLQ